MGRLYMLSFLEQEKRRTGLAYSPLSAPRLGIKAHIAKIEVSEINMASIGILTGRKMSWTRFDIKA